ncbi:MAG: hypothetical protein COZ58_04270, partial [Candidatus Infernicultor aquiphilus]
STIKMSKDEYGRGVLHTPFQERSILEKHKDKLYFYFQIYREEDLPEPILKEVTDNNISPGQASKDLSNLLEKRLIRKQGRGRAICSTLIIYPAYLTCNIKY